MELDLRVVAVLLSGMATVLVGGLGILIRVSRWHTEVTTKMDRMETDIRHLLKRTNLDHDKLIEIAARRKDPP